jgi:hypothetical protein
VMLMLKYIRMGPAKALGHVKPTHEAATVPAE